MDLNCSLLVDDGRGVGEALDEPMWTNSPIGLIIRGSHKLSIDSASLAASAKVAMQQNALFPTTVSFAPFSGTPQTWVQQYTAKFSGLVGTLPSNIHLLTAHSQNATTVLIRLAHLFEIDDSSPNNGNVTVSLGPLFSGFAITAATELSLIANQAVTDIPNFTYHMEGEASVTLPVLPPAPNGSNLAVTLSPMQIRTFLCTIAVREHTAAQVAAPSGILVRADIE